MIVTATSRTLIIKNTGKIVIPHEYRVYAQSNDTNATSGFDIAALWNSSNNAVRPIMETVGNLCKSIVGGLNITMLNSTIDYLCSEQPVIGFILIIVLFIVIVVVCIKVAKRGKKQEQQPQQVTQGKR